MKTFKIFILIYAVSVAFFWGFNKISLKYFNPTIVVKEDAERSKIFSDISVKDFIKYGGRFYILSEDNKIYIYNIRKSKITKIIKIDGLENITRITVHRHIKVGKKKEKFFIIGFLANSKVYLSKLDIKMETKVLQPTLYLENLKNPKNIYLYNEYYKELPGIYQDYLAVLEKNDNRSIIKVFNLKTKELVEELKATINIKKIVSKEPVKKYNPDNIINFRKSSRYVGEKRTRKVLNKIEIAPGNNYKIDISTITYDSCYIISDTKNSATWLNNNIGWLFRKYMIKFKHTPDKAYFLSDRLHDSDSIVDGREKVMFVVKYQNSNKLKVVKTESTVLKELTKFSEKAFWILVQPFITFGLILAYSLK